MHTIYIVYKIEMEDKRYGINFLVAIYEEHLHAKL